MATGSKSIHCTGKRSHLFGKTAGNYVYFADRRSVNHAGRTRNDERVLRSSQCKAATAVLMRVLIWILPSRSCKLVSALLSALENIMPASVGTSVLSVHIKHVERNADNSLC